MSRDAPHIACGQDGTGRAGGSSGDFAERQAGKNAGKGFDPFRERALFPDRWSRWCRENFANSTQLGAAFGINEKTARLWMAGDSAPSGWAVAAAKDGLISNVIPFGQEPARPARRKVAA